MEEEQVETVPNLTKNLEESEIPLAFELLSELPSTCSISSDSAKFLALENRNLREKNIALEQKISEIESNFTISLDKVRLEQKKQLERMEAETLERNQQISDLIKRLQDMNNQLGQNQVLIQQMSQENDNLKQEKKQLQSTIDQYKKKEEKEKKRKQFIPVNASANKTLLCEPNHQ